MLMAGISLFAPARTLREGAVDFGITGSQFPAALGQWEKGMKWSEDDNFFISRVKPKERFRNQATQINPKINERDDKNLICWLPVNSQPFNALPDGAFDREVFSMWSYVTHYGNWSANLVRVPGGFLDVAHRNGVAVSAVAPVALGNISAEWKEALEILSSTSPEKFASYLSYYGVDGIGYNSEFVCDASLVEALGELHGQTRSILRNNGNHVAEFIWYDGTSSYGNVLFDVGLALHNQEIWGYGDHERTSLFLNYNWNTDRLLNQVVDRATSLGRTSLDVYCGINLQGREPSIPNREIWPVLANYPVSIGLWGAHNDNMFFESRMENGGDPLQSQRTYRGRLERWFSGSTRNPITAPALNNSLAYSENASEFAGMAKMMSARSSLKWDLSEEPFITYFNLGNGRFFNYKGIRQHNSEWYNIAMQDYLPTWMWWFTDRFMGRDEASVPKGGLTADFVWDDAWMGGSSLRIYGQTPEEYLHLFKTGYELKDGDEIIVRFKAVDGSADIFLVLSQENNEEVDIAGESLKLMDRSLPLREHWIEKKFVVGKDFTLPTKDDIAMVALRFRNAYHLDLRLGEFSIVRPQSMPDKVQTPIVEKTEVLAARHDGVDGKIIFNMPNDKGDDVCYNIDVDASYFKLYFQQENQEPVLMGMTTSWAGLMFSSPYIYGGSEMVRFGVSALGLDQEVESDIAWSEYMEVTNLFESDDRLTVSREVIHPDDSFTISYIDPSHDLADWAIKDQAGNILYESKDAGSIEVVKGLPSTGAYDLVINGIEYINGENKPTERELKGFITVIDSSLGDIPELLAVESSNAILKENEAEISVFGYEKGVAELSYSLREGDINSSRGVKIGKDAFGFQFKDTGIETMTPFSVSFWLRPETFDGNSVHLLNIRNRNDKWIQNHWGWCWHTLAEDGTSSAFTIRLENDETASYDFGELKLTPGSWYHMAYVFDFDEENRIIPHLFVNGKEEKITARYLSGKFIENDAPLGVAKHWDDNYVVALGGYLHKLGSVNGTVDDFMLWEKAIDENDLKEIMSGLKEIPESLSGYFDFEDEAEPSVDVALYNKGHRDFRAGSHSYIESELEGQAIFKWTKPEFTLGSPFSAGFAYSNHTRAQWNAPGCLIGDTEYSKDGGLTVIRLSDTRFLDIFPEGIPTLLTLTNGHGSTTKEMKLIFKESNISAVGNEVATEVFPTCFTDHIGIKCAEAGRLTVSLYAMDGSKILSNTFDNDGSTIMKIYPETSAGTYVLVLTKDGKKVCTRKVIKK